MAHTFFERVLALTSQTKKDAVAFGIQLPDVFRLHAPKDIRSTITSRHTSSLAEVIGNVGGHDTGGKGAWKLVITCWVHLELMCTFPTM